MFDEPPIRWIAWAIIVFVAMRSLMSMSILLRDRLQGLLVAHVKRQQIESQKRQRITELRERIRAKKANVSGEETQSKKAA